MKIYKKDDLNEIIIIFWQRRAMKEKERGLTMKNSE